MRLSDTRNQARSNRRRFGSFANVREVLSGRRMAETEMKWNELERGMLDSTEWIWQWTESSSVFAPRTSRLCLTVFHHQNDGMTVVILATFLLGLEETL